MKPAGIIGIILIVVGIIALAYGGFSYRDGGRSSVASQRTLSTSALGVAK